MDDLKREGNFQDEEALAKRSKVTGIDVGSLEEGNTSLDTRVIMGIQTASSESNVEIGSNHEKEHLEDNKRTWAPAMSSLSVYEASCSSEVQEDVGKLYPVEADVAEDKGSRHTMEDAWVVLPDASLEYPGKLRCAYFAIYDGHGGRLAAEYAQNHLHLNVLSAGLPRESMDVKAAKKAILEGFRRTDESILQESAKGNWQDGATAVCVWILGQTVLVANIGDAKAVLARSATADGSQALSNGTGSSLKAIVMTRDHKAIFPHERVRIQKVGVIATPDVHSFELTEREQFIILGCDGLWGGYVPSLSLFEELSSCSGGLHSAFHCNPDYSWNVQVFGPSDAVDFVQKQLQAKVSAAAAARRLVREAVCERRCKDNCTAIIIIFRHS